MVDLPSPAKGFQVLLQFVGDAEEFLSRKAVILPRGYFPGEAVELEDCFMPASHHMHMRRGVVAGINDHAHPEDAKDCGHEVSVAGKAKWLG
jgi:hypothetical protein